MQAQREKHYDFADAQYSQAAGIGKNSFRFLFLFFILFNTTIDRVLQ